MKFLFESEKGRDDAVQELLGLELVATFRLSFGDPTGDRDLDLNHFPLVSFAKREVLARCILLACSLLIFIAPFYLCVEDGLAFSLELIFLFCLDLSQSLFCLVS